MEPQKPFENLKAINAQIASKASDDKRHQEIQIGFIETQKVILEAFRSLVDYMDKKVTKTQLVNQLKSIQTPDAFKVVASIDDLHKTLKTHDNTDLSEVTSILRRVLSEAEKLPKSHQKIEIPKQIDNTKQLESLKKAVDLVNESIKKQELKVEAPVVNVAAPEVHVDAPDLKPIAGGISKEFAKAIKSIVFPEYKTDNKEVEKLLKKTNKLLDQILEKPVGGAGGGSSRATPYSDASGMPSFPRAVESAATPGVVSVAVVNPDGTNIGSGGGGSGVAAFSDSGGTDRKGLVDVDRHVQTDVLTIPGIAGDVAHDAADSGSPIKLGGKATTSTPTPVSNGDRTDASFDEYGRLIISDRDPETGLYQGTTSLRDRQVVQRYTVISDSVADGLNGIWTLSTTGSGVTPTVVAGSGEGTLQTGAAINSSSQMVSTVLRYHPGQESWLNSAFRFAAATTGNTQRIGACTVSGTTPQDGFYFERNGTTFDAVVVKAGVELSRTASTAWTRVVQAPFTVDTNYHSYEFRFTANGVSFYADNILRHRVTGGSTTLTSTLDFPMFIQNVNTTNNTNITVGIRNIGMGRFGTPPTEYTSGSILADQTGAGAVQTFTFSIPVDFIWVTDIGATTTNVSRVDPFGGTPAATTGIPVLNGAPTPINVVPANSTVRVYAPVGSTITMHGFRYV